MAAGAHDNSDHRVAVRLPSDKQLLDNLEQFLAVRGWASAERFAAKDDDELNDRLCAGEFDAVVFAGPEEALQMVWAGHGVVSRWTARDKASSVEIHFVETEPAVGPGNSWPELLRRIECSHSGWEADRRRRQIIAGCILTAVALLAMGVLLWTRA